MKKIFILIMCSLLATALHAQDGFGTYLRDVIQKQEKGILVTAKLIEACGLCDSLDLLMDYEYERRYQTGNIPTTFQDYISYNTFYAPEHRKYGYTLFAETDDLWETLTGKQYANITADDVRGFLVASGMFPSALNNDDYQDEDNVLNQFVTYHLLPHRLSPDKLVNHVNEYGYNIQADPETYSIPVTEYYVTMGKRRLLRTYESAESNGVYLNRFPKEDKTRQGTGHEVSCDPDKEGIYIDKEKFQTCSPNGVVYPISKLLAYTDDVANQLGSIRLRFDIAGLFPELTNNDIRLNPSSDQRFKNVYIPTRSSYPYLNDLTDNDWSSYVLYNTGWNNGWYNLNGDEFSVAGMYDVILRLPPVPRRGTYELRYRVLASAYRGIAQIYFGSDKDNLLPAGLPIDFTRQLNNPQFGGEHDNGEDYADQMQDNNLHFNGIMKGAKSVVSRGTDTERNQYQCLRYILVRQTMDPDKTYYVRFKSVLDTNSKSLFLDYIELCPKDVYDNPDMPEDIW